MCVDKLFLIVLYGKKPINSETINSILNLDFDFSSYHLIIHNNGPNTISENDFEGFGLIERFGFFNIRNTIDNQPLSKIYNDVLLSKKDINWFTLLDDDTEINIEYLCSIKSNSSADVILPRIIDAGVCYYPVSSGRVVKDNHDVDSIGGEVLSIGSGLTISRKLINKFSSVEMTPFDERFALYGVDFSFFRRLTILKKIFDVKLYISGELSHSLSRNILDYSEFRHYERVTDVLLSAKYYPRYSFEGLWVLIKVLIREIKNLRPRCLFYALKIYIIGKHPRT